MAAIRPSHRRQARLPSQRSVGRARPARRSCGMTSTIQTVQPLVRAPGAPGPVPHVGVTVNILVRAADTDGAWSMLDYTMPARFAGPPAHRHAHTTETFYCVAGEVTLTLDGRAVRLRA